MLPTEIEFRNFYKKDARFVKKLKESSKIEDIRLYDAMTKYFLEFKIQEREEEVKRRALSNLNSKLGE
jgi:hypothetical protein